MGASQAKFAPQKWLYYGCAYALCISKNSVWICHH